MGKFYGKVGYVTTELARPGVWEDNLLDERYYFGDIIDDTRRWQSTENLNDNLSVTNRISIVADQFAYQNFSKIKYIEWLGVLWKVVSIEPKRPRLILTLGGEYNGAVDISEEA